MAGVALSALMKSHLTGWRLGAEALRWPTEVPLSEQERFCSVSACSSTLGEEQRCSLRTYCNREPMSRCVQ